MSNERLVKKINKEFDVCLIKKQVASDVFAKLVDVHDVENRLLMSMDDLMNGPFSTLVFIHCTSNVMSDVILRMAMFTDLKYHGVYRVLNYVNGSKQDKRSVFDGIVQPSNEFVLLFFNTNNVTNIENYVLYKTQPQRCEIKQSNLQPFYDDLCNLLNVDNRLMMTDIPKQRDETKERNYNTLPLSNDFAKMYFEDGVVKHFQSKGSSKLPKAERPLRDFDRFIKNISLKTFDDLTPAFNTLIDTSKPMDIRQSAWESHFKYLPPPEDKAAFDNVVLDGALARKWTLQKKAIRRKQRKGTFKPKNKRKSKSGIQIPGPISKQLFDFLTTHVSNDFEGVDEQKCARSTCNSLIWKYITANNLMQSNRITPDENLRMLLTPNTPSGTPLMNFGIGKCLNPHFASKDAVVLPVAPPPAPRLKPLDNPNTGNNVIDAMQL